MTSAVSTCLVLWVGLNLAFVAWRVLATRPVKVTVTPPGRPVLRLVR